MKKVDINKNMPACNHTLRSKMPIKYQTKIDTGIRESRHAIVCSRVDAE